MAVLAATEVSAGWQARAVSARTARQLWARIGLSEEGRRRIYPPDSALGKFLNLERETGSHLASYTWRLVTVSNGHLASYTWRLVTVRNGTPRFARGRL